jgi:hypothetical protein
MADSIPASNFTPCSAKPQALACLGFACDFGVVGQCKGGRFCLPIRQPKSTSGLPRDVDCKAVLPSDFFVEYKTIIASIASAQKEHFSASRC